MTRAWARVQLIVRVSSSGFDLGIPTGNITLDQPQFSMRNAKRAYQALTILVARTYVYLYTMDVYVYVWLMCAECATQENVLRAVCIRGLRGRPDAEIY